MPPRLPFILVFFACYFAVIIGGGASALSRVLAVAPPEFLTEHFGVAQIRVTIAELIAAIAALAAAPDTALRPVRSALDRLISLAIAAGAIAIAIIEPRVATLGYAALTALALGDAAAALFQRRRGARI